MSGWIDVDDRMPGRGDHVLIWSPEYGTGLAECRGDHFRHAGYGDLAWSATHWMPLPAGPNGEPAREPESKALPWDHPYAGVRDIEE